MKSRANIKSHPLHPILVCFPIAFFTGTFLCDVTRVFIADPFYAGLARVLGYAGIMGAIAAAIPGVIDYAYTVPPESSAKKRATRHGLLNVAVLCIFIFTSFIRSHYAAVVIAAIEVPAIVLLCMAGWMGGTLVHRNQIGVDIRYAQAGKWKEKSYYGNDNRIKLDVSALKENQMYLLHVNKKRIVIARSNGTISAFDDKCPHRGGSLAAGSLICGTVQCPWHGSQFSITSGEVTAGPASTPVKTYAVIEDKGDYYLSLS
jgi:nitrite reductase/ring-hydroxylating ferredoxin subunit/uncharacterized membrane protein